MDPIRFDRMAQSLATASRRRLVSGVLAAASAILLGAGVDEGLARKGKKKRKPLNSRGKRKGLNQACGEAQGVCVETLECCKKQPGDKTGACKRQLHDPACVPDLETGRDANCCTGFCAVFDGCCKGPTQACSGASECCRGLNCGEKGKCCVPLGEPCSNADECCGDDTSCPAGTCIKSCPQRARGSVGAEGLDDECCPTGLICGSECCASDETCITEGSFQRCCRPENVIDGKCCRQPLTVRGERCCPGGSGQLLFCGRFRCMGRLPGTGPRECDWWCDNLTELVACDDIPVIPPQNCCCVEVHDDGTGTVIIETCLEVPG